MNDNPYSTPLNSQEPLSTASRLTKSLVAILKFFGAYILGILICITLTDGDLHLAGKNLLLWYLLLAPVGFILWFVAAFQGLPSPPFEMGWALVVVLFPFVGEGIAYASHSTRLRSWRALWIGLPIGFLGALGIYWAGSLSI